MLQRLQTQLSRKHRQGFAIGTILLAVVLIAAIVSAIAIASRGSSQDAELERARLTASILLSQATDLSLAASRMVSSGVARTELMLQTPLINSYAPGFPSLISRCTNEPACIFLQSGPKDVPPSIFLLPATDFYRDWFIWEIRTIFGFPSLSNRISFIGIMGVTEPICRQFLSLTQGQPPSANIPVNADVDFFAVLRRVTTIASPAEFDFSRGGCIKSSRMDINVYLIYIPFTG